MHRLILTLATAMVIAAGTACDNREYTTDELTHIEQMRGELMKISNAGELLQFSDGQIYRVVHREETLITIATLIHNGVEIERQFNIYGPDLPSFVDRVITSGDDDYSEKAAEYLTRRPEQ